MGQQVMGAMRVCLTIDIDFTGYAHGGALVDELSTVCPEVFRILGRYGAKATWFMRLDHHMESLYGQGEHIFHRYGAQLAELLQAGHEIGWHPHCWVKSNAGWKQNVDVHAVVKELGQYAPVARSYGLKAVRMGWGFHTNETMSFLASQGFTVDSSAIPRPRYSWEETVKDWTLTSPAPYFPSRADYRVSGEPGLTILELPISVAHVEAPYDTGRVLRYLNLAYHPPLLKEPLARWMAQHSHLITVTHPYELLPREEPHGLLAFQLGAFEENLLSIGELADRGGTTVSFLTVSEFAEWYRRKNHD